MQAIETHIKSLQGKLQELIKKYQFLEKKASQQEAELNQLRTQRLSDEKKIKQLEEKQLIMKNSVGKMEAADKKALEQLINRYVREIDKCIALLSE